MSEQSPQTSPHVDSKESLQDVTAAHTQSGEYTGPVHERVGAGVSLFLQAAGRGLRRVSDYLTEQNKAIASEAHQSGEGVPEGWHIPEEFRGVVERYPIQSLLVSCGAGYLLATLVGGKRK